MLAFLRGYLPGGLEDVALSFHPGFASATLLGGAGQMRVGHIDTETELDGR